MGTFVLRRLLQMIPVFLGATLLIYYMVFAMPGDPVAALCGERGCDPATQARLREQFNLDEPFLMQYLNYLKGALTLDFGQTFTGRPVADVLAQAFPVTIRLALVAFAFEILVGIPLGLLAGLRRGTFTDTALLMLTLLIVSIPIFVVGFVAQYWLGVKWGVAPATVGGKEGFAPLLLPGAVLGLTSVAYITRLTRASIAENTRADYVRTAIAKGLPRRRVIGSHLLRNSLIPVVTYLGTDLGALMGGAIITEGIFNVPGVGNTIYRAILAGEAVTIVSFVTVLVMIFLLANLLVDLLYALLDPRIRLD